MDCSSLSQIVPSVGRSSVGSNPRLEFVVLRTYGNHNNTDAPVLLTVSGCGGIILCQRRDIQVRQHCKKGDIWGRS